jgi:starch synthase (maltosyl-transferring)
MTTARQADAALATAPARVVVERVRPHVDGGCFAVKRTVGEALAVEADVFTDGHDTLAVVLRSRRAGETAWRETPMAPLGNDVWRATLALEEMGVVEYDVEAWIDRFASWRSDLAKRVEAQQAVGSELLEGAGLVRATAARAAGDDRIALAHAAERLAAADLPESERAATALDAELARRMAAHPDRRTAVRSALATVRVERPRARFGAWYEMFPRSAGTDPNRSATLREAEARLPAIAAMGFDVVYLPPIHPIGVTHRKGRNNALIAAPDDPGSPWAIGGPAGGHDAVDPALGTLDDFRHFVAAARARGLEVALDVAFQCSPDHPYVRSHPEWFRHRPDGSIKYAENPPKKYQDIFPFDFECLEWRALWEELRRVVLFWVQQGVVIFRVDNPHTKPFAFWDWLIAEVQAAHPETIFLSEAFTRPKVMKRLAKGGFTQSYSYFTWRNGKDELVEYFTELTQTDVREYMRPNLFTNTPDILHAYLQHGGRAAFQVRLVLAATLGATYGIYGPPFELCVGTAVPGTEEYLDSEKYQVRVWDHDRPGHIRELVTTLNAARRAHPALQYDHGLRFHPIDDPEILFYSKSSPDGASLVLVAVNLDPATAHHGWVDLPLAELGLPIDAPFEVRDVLSGALYQWSARNWVRLDPAELPAHVFVVRAPGGAA